MHDAIMRDAVMCDAVVRDAEVRCIASFLIHFAFHTFKNFIIREHLTATELRLIFFGLGGGEHA